MKFITGDDGDVYAYNEYGTQAAVLSQPRQADVWVFTSTAMLLQWELEEILNKMKELRSVR